MVVRRSLSVVIVCVVGLVLLTGCVTTLAPARALVSPGTESMSVFDVAVAVQANGIKHYVWNECSSEQCQLVYQRIVFGAPIYQYTFTAASGTRINYPDVAVTDDGRAFVVHNLCSSTCIDYYSLFPAGANSTTPITLEQLASPGGASAGPPKLKARDNLVFATYLVEDEPHPRLRYRQLSGGTNGGYVDPRPLVRPEDPSVAIGSNGALYATWQVQIGSSSEIVYGTNSGMTSDFGPPTSYIASESYSFHHPDIALDPSNTPYIVYAYDEGTSDIVKIRCQAAESACFGSVTDRTITLDGARNPWLLRGSPHIAVLGTSPAVVFSARNNASDNDEIWYYTPPSSGIDPGPSRATTNSVADGEPLIAVERSNFGDVPVVAWRTYVKTFKRSDPPEWAECIDDAYVFHFNTTTIRRVFDGAVNALGCNSSSQDLDANEQWVAGAWIALGASQTTGTVPWTIFNANTTYAPIIGQ